MGISQRADPKVPSDDIRQIAELLAADRKVHVRQDHRQPSSSEDVSSASGSSAERPVAAVIFGIWLAWAICLLGFQELVAARINLQGPDYALNWTPAYTQPNSSVRTPYVSGDTLNTHAAWDSSYYLSIAIAGYDDPTMTRTTPTGDLPSISADYAFLPLYPWAIRVVSLPLLLIGMATIPAAVIAGVAIDLVATLLAMLAMYRIAEPSLGRAGGLRATFYMLIFPSGFFLAQVYPEALFLCLSLGAIALAADRRPLPAAAAAALAVWTRPTGFLLVFPLGLAFLGEASRRWPLGRARSEVPELLRELGPWTAAAVAPLASYFVWWLVLGQQFSIAETWFQRHVLDLGVFLQYWPSELTNILNYGPQSRAYLSLEFGSTALAIGACVWALRRWPGIALYGLGTIILPMLSAAPQSMIRYVLAVPAIFLLLGRLGKNGVFDRGWTLASTLIMGLLTTLFTFKLWVA